MKLTETSLAGAYVIDVEPQRDERGYFARTFCQNEFAAFGFNTAIAQTSISFNTKAGTLRGMHFQYPPVAETKIIRCTQGALFDVIVDLRPESPTFGSHASVELSAENQRALYIPARFAHGFLTLTDETVASYLISEFYTPGLSGGLRFDDATLEIDWPIIPGIAAERDLAWGAFTSQVDSLRDRMSAGADGLAQS